MRIFRLSSAKAPTSRPGLDTQYGRTWPVELGETITRLWIAPEYQRVAATFTYEDGESLSCGCWEDVEKDPVWQADLINVNGDPCPEPEFSPDLRWVVSECCYLEKFDRYVLPVTTDVEPRYFLGNDPEHAPEYPVFSPDGRFLYAMVRNAKRRYEIKRWDTPALFKTCSRKRAKGGYGVSPVPDWAIPGSTGTSALSPDNRFIAFWAQRGSVYVSNLTTTRTVVVLPAQRNASWATVERLTFSLNGSLLAILRSYRIKSRRCLEQELSVCEPKRGAKERRVKVTESVNAMAFAADSTRLFTACSDGSVGVWDVAKLKKIREYRWNIGKLFCIVVAPDGLTCAAGGENRQVVVWDVDS